MTQTVLVANFAITQIVSVCGIVGKAILSARTVMVGMNSRDAVLENSVQEGSAFDLFNSSMGSCTGTFFLTF